MSKFKVGDWVRNINDGYVGKITACVNDPLSYHLNGNHSVLYMIESSLELWKPEPNDWCWFWHKDLTNLPYLDQFDKLENGYYIAIRNFQYRNCEPFTGILPTVLQ